MYRVLGALAFGFATLSGASAQELPNSLVETYADWTLRCVPVEGKQTCQMMQELSQKETGQRVLAFVINAPKPEDVVDATLILPFGLELAKGISAHIDAEFDLEPIQFSTCLPSGCLASVELNAELIGKMQAGEQFSLNVHSISSQQPVSIDLSLSGFSAAFRRLSDLSKAS